MIYIYLPENVWDWYKKLADHERRPLSNLIRGVIEDSVKLDDPITHDAPARGKGYSLRASSGLIKEIENCYPHTSVHHAARNILADYYQKYSSSGEVFNRLARAINTNQTQNPKL